MRSSSDRPSFLGAQNPQSLPTFLVAKSPQSLPMVSSATPQRRRVKKRAKFSSQSLRQDSCFRAFVGLLTLQLFILVLVTLTVGDHFEQAILSRVETLRLFHDYYRRHVLPLHVPTKDTVPAGIVVDDDDASSKHPVDSKVVVAAGGDDDLHELEDHIANRTMERLNEVEQQQQQQQQQADEHQDSVGSDTSRSQDSSSHLPPIDNYYTRQLQQARGNDRPFEFLIVGGSDGSGTRAFVTALGKLGVPMIVDDSGTMDIHGKQLFKGQGWPPLVQMVLNHTNSANYKVEDLPQDVRKTVMKELKKLQKDLVRRGKRYDQHGLTNHKHPLVNHYYKNVQKWQDRLLRHRQLFHGRNLMEGTEFSADPESAAVGTGPNVTTTQAAANKSTLVQYGFKAPVTMLLLPFLREVFGPIKFLHVVRDGRDVALSANQSPVKKFYNSYYQKPGDLPVNVTLAQNDTTMNVFAMQLWNDWNLQVLEYEKAHFGKDFDYLVMKTEDLLNPETKFASLQQLAHFVGSRNSMQDLCCQSQLALVDMGVSTSNIGDKNKTGRKPRHVYDHMFQKASHRIHDFQGFEPLAGPKLEGNQQHFSPDEYDYHADYEHHKHGELGRDPILGFLEVANQPLSDSKFDMEEGRHLNWHHGLLDAGSILSDARERRTQFNQQRHDTFRRLADRVARFKTRIYGPLVPPEMPGGKAPQDGGDDKDHNVKIEPAQSLAYRIAANHLARRQEQDPDLVSPRRNHPDTPDEHRRRLLSSFNKKQIRHVPYAQKKAAPDKELAEGGDGQQHRQFKPHHQADKLFHELRAENGEKSMGYAENKPIDSSWSIPASVGKVLGLQSGAANSPPANNFDIDQNQPPQQKPLFEVGVPHRHFPSHHGMRMKTKKPANVKARYGKWVSFLEDKPLLSQHLHDLGAKSLEAFGYEPSAPFLDTSGADESFQCDSTVECTDHMHAFHPAQ